MNKVYYLVGQLSKDKSIGITGGHGYTYNPNEITKKKVSKDVPTLYGYYSGHEHQNLPIKVEKYLNGRVVGNYNIQTSLIKHLDLIFSEMTVFGYEKVLIITGLPKLTKEFTAGKHNPAVDEELFKHAYKGYLACKDNLIIDYDLYPKGGFGIQQAYNQARLGMLLLELPNTESARIDEISEEEFKNPFIDINKLVNASRWYFNTGDRSKYYDLKNGRRVYHFGRVDPAKNYYGKATPDSHYCSLYTDSPIVVFDKLYEFCKNNKPNPYNLLFAGNINNIKSKEVAKVIDILPGSFVGNEMLSAVTIAGKDEAPLVDFIDPPGLSYRVVDALDNIDAIYDFFMNRDNENKFGKSEFIDITNYFYVQDKGKYKLHPEFNNSVLKMIIPITSPNCVKKVKVGLSIGYDTPTRTNFSSITKDKVGTIKVWLALDFGDPNGVAYCTIVETEHYSYIQRNANAFLRVYSLSELGRK